jgi:hypothetical protein
MNSKITQRALAAIIVLIIAYWAAGFLPTEQNLYHHLADLPGSAPLDEIKSQALLVTQKSQDANLQFSSQYIYDIADYLQRIGYKRLSDVTPGGAFVRSFIDGFTNPSLVNIGKAFKLWWNKDKFSATWDSLQAKYGGQNYLSILIAIAAASFTWMLMLSKHKAIEAQIVTTRITN